MRILFMPLAGNSTYLQLVPLAWACRAAGHDVRIASRPPLDLVLGSGLPVIKAGGNYDYDAGLNEAYQITVRELGHKPTPEDMKRLSPEVMAQLRNVRLVAHVRAAADMAADVVPFVQHWRPDLVVALPNVIAASIAAAAAGAPLARYLFGPDIVRRIGFPGVGQDPEQWPAELHTLYEHYDIKPQADLAVCNIDPCPDPLQLPDVPDRVRVRFMPYNGNAEVPDWLQVPAERPRVMVSWSTSNKGEEFFAIPKILDGLAQLDVEVVATIPPSERELLTSVPDNVRLVSGLPLNLVLPSCEAFVHHGGSGTMLTSSYFGVPQIVVPMVLDDILDAQLVASSGAGVHLSDEQASPDAIKAAVGSVLTDGDNYRAAAARLRSEIHEQPSPWQLVSTLEELA